MLGSCLCGSVKFEISDESPRIYQCHCSLCKKVSGSSSNSAMLVNSKTFRWSAGKNHIVKYSTPSGFKSEFCGKCGSPVPNTSSNTELYWVPAGLLEEPLNTKLVAHVHIDSRGSWDDAFLEDALPKYQKMPDHQEFIELLHGKDA